MPNYFQVNSQGGLFIDDSPKSYEVLNWMLDNCSSTGQINYLMGGEVNLSSQEFLDFILETENSNYGMYYSMPASLKYITKSYYFNGFIPNHNSLISFLSSKTYNDVLMLARTLGNYIPLPVAINYLSIYLDLLIEYLSSLNYSLNPSDEYESRILDNISTSSVYSYQYATQVLKGRFEQGEVIILKDPYYKDKYTEFLNNKRRLLKDEK